MTSTIKGSGGKRHQRKRDFQTQTGPRWISRFCTNERDTRIQRRNHFSTRGSTSASPVARTPPCSAGSTEARSNVSFSNELPTSRPSVKWRPCMNGGDTCLVNLTRCVRLPTYLSIAESVNLNPMHLRAQEGRNKQTHTHAKHAKNHNEKKR